MRLQRRRPSLKSLSPPDRQPPKGDNLIVVEAMKMENHVLSAKDATVVKVNVNVGEMVLSQNVLIELE